MKTLEELQEEMKKTLSDKRFRHVLSVRDEVLHLSDVFALDSDTLVRAALLHDCTKEWSFDEHLQYAKNNSYPLSDSDIKSPPVLHARTGALRARLEFEESKSVADIILCHTTGKAKMSLEEKILFLSDFIEKERTYTACTEARRKFYSDIEAARSCKERLSALDRAVSAALEFTVLYLQKNKTFVHPDTLCAIKYLGEI